MTLLSRIAAPESFYVKHSDSSLVILAVEDVIGSLDLSNLSNSRLQMLVHKLRADIGTDEA